MSVTFGTGGWRAVIGDGFTKANVQLLTAALARKMKVENAAQRGFLIGYDRRFLSREAAHWAAEVMAGADIPCMVVEREAPTPLIMFAVKYYELSYGMAVTASHNPALYNGVKMFVKGGRDADELVTAGIEEHIAARFGETCHEVPVGFKHISGKMLETGAVIGGESSGGLTVRGHIQGKDGIYAAALLVEMMSTTGRSLSELYREVTALCGSFEMVERGYRFSREEKEQISRTLMEDKLLPDFGVPVEKVSYADGCKVYFQGGGWVVSRFSGTEPLLRVFCEMQTAGQAAEVARRMEVFLGLEDRNIE